jgi:hypothetical protein
MKKFHPASDFLATTSGARRGMRDAEVDDADADAAAAEPALPSAGADELCEGADMVGG